ncbi:MAG TPA: hypothetical protein VFX09_02880, partial [Burkholderiales bacterium]|nr:hypothetical protein [Burkholderiales bacterium]
VIIGTPRKCAYLLASILGMSRLERHLGCSVFYGMAECAPKAIGGAQPTEAEAEAESHYNSAF